MTQLNEGILYLVPGLYGYVKRILIQILYRSEVKLFIGYPNIVKCNICSNYIKMRHIYMYVDRGSNIANYDDSLKLWNSSQCEFFSSIHPYATFKTIQKEDFQWHIMLPSENSLKTYNNHLKEISTKDMWHCFYLNLRFYNCVYVMNGFGVYWMIKYRSMVWYVQQQSYKDFVESSVTLLS